MKTIETALAKMVTRAPFYASVAMQLPLIKGGKDIPTACTDGKRIWFNPACVATLTPTQVIGLVAHEVKHVAHEHVYRRGNRDVILTDGKGKNVSLWNVACDYVINRQLDQDGFDLPPGGLFDARFDGMSEEQVYSMLEKEYEGKQGGGGGGDGDVPSTCDELLPADGSQSDQNNQRQDVREIVAGACKMAKAIGKLPGAFESYMEKLLHPKLAWHEILREFFTALSNQDFSWSRPNKRYIDTGFYLPSSKSNTLGEGILAQDVSGSMLDPVISRCFTEMDHVLVTLKPDRVVIVQCDCEVNDWKEYYPGDPMDYKAKGRGGTSFEPVFDAIAQRGETPQFLVYFTDGYGRFPDQAPPYPVLWAMTTDVTPPWGTILRLGEE